MNDSLGKPTLDTLVTCIQEDLTSLYELDRITRSTRINTELGNPLFCANMQPMYFTGKPDAKTVLVMLNPGAENHSYHFSAEDKERFPNTESFIQYYIDRRIRYGDLDQDRQDAFDLKQAAFLYYFSDSGVQLPERFWDDDALKLVAKRNVLMQKLQLELVPYPSRSFPGIFSSRKKAIANLAWILPHLERLFDAITAEERTHVLFCSKQFTTLLKALASEKSKSWNIRLSERHSTKEIIKNRPTNAPMSAYCLEVMLWWAGARLSVVQTMDDRQRLADSPYASQDRRLSHPTS